VRFGVDRLLTDQADALRNARIGLVTSDVARTASTGRTSRIALHEAGYQIVHLFGPEHGLAGNAEDGAKVTDAVDVATGLPVTSLYGEKLRPTPETLADLDVMMFDIPDVGARFYTYIWTLSHVMEACADAGKPVYVLDRPNPIGGDLDAAEGPGLDEAAVSSFVGRWDIPVRYSLTIGELARVFKSQRRLDVDLQVVPLGGWNRRMHWPQTGLDFVPPSPAMTSYQTALIYPGTCLIEGTNLSEGRGTDSPFELIGAPWMDGARVAAAFNELKLEGIVAAEAIFTPTGRKHAGQRCGGVRLKITNPARFRPVRAGMHLIAQVIRLHPEEFQWLPYPTAANQRGLQHFDRLIGNLQIRTALGAGGADAAAIRQWTATNGWKAQCEQALIYS
jgi:uncharacterized protein YbbC (DUF1343 family)